MWLRSSDVSPKSANSSGTHDKRRQFLKKLTVPLALTIIGFGVLRWAYSIFPSRSDVIPPPSFRVTVQSQYPVVDLSMSIGPADNSSKMTIEFWAADTPRRFIKNPDTPGPPPVGITIESEVPLSCELDTPSVYSHCFSRAGQIINRSEPRYKYIGNLELRDFDYYGRSRAFVEVTADSPNFGYSANGVSALALIPAFNYQAPGDTVVKNIYHIPDSPNYDWSGSLTRTADIDSTTWFEKLTHSSITSEQEVAGAKNQPSSRSGRYVLCWCSSRHWRLGANSGPAGGPSPVG